MDKSGLDKLKEEIAEKQQELTKARISGSLKKAYDLQDEIELLQTRFRVLKGA